jgi:hypothetical protein
MRDNNSVVDKHVCTEFQQEKGGDKDSNVVYYYVGIGHDHWTDGEKGGGILDERNGDGDEQDLVTQSCMMFHGRISVWREKLDEQTVEEVGLLLASRMPRSESVWNIFPGALVDGNWLR